MATANNPVQNPVYSYKRFTTDDVISTERSAINALFITTSSIATGSFMFETSSISTTYFVKLTGSNSTEGSYDIATVAFGYSGSGNHTSESLTLYQQYTNFFVGKDGTASAHFQFSPTANASTSEQEGFLAIMFARDRMDDQLEPGSWMIRMTPKVKTINATYSFTDAAAASASNPVTNYGKRGRWDYIYSGTRRIGSAVGTVVGQPMGMVFYDYGAVILNGMKTSSGVWTPSGSDPSRVGGLNNSGCAGFFTCAQEICGYGVSKLKSTIYFCRVGNREFNFSQNPTFGNPSTGVIINSELRNSPRTYITTVGFYNDRDELIALGKLNSPVENTFTKEAIIQAMLSY